MSFEFQNAAVFNRK